MKNYCTILFIIFNLTVHAQQDLETVRKQLEKGSIKESKAILEARYKANPDDLHTALLLGDIAGFEKNWDEALSYYKKCLIKNPANADINFRYGGVLGLKALAVPKIKAMIYIPDIKKYLEKAAELDPKHIKSRRALVELYMQLPGILGGSQSKAQGFADEIKKIAPLEGALSQAYILKQTGKESEARNLVQKALAQIKDPYPGSDQNYLNYEFGKITGEYKTDLLKGLKLLDAYILNYSYKDMHSLDWAYYRKAQIHSLLKNKAEATLFINKALAINVDFEEAKLEKKKIQEL